MDRNKRLLVAIDDSEAPNRAVRYVGEILGGLKRSPVSCSTCRGLCRRGAFRDAETREGEEKPEEAVVRKQNQQIKKSVAEVRRYAKKQKPCSLAPDSRPKLLRGIALFGSTGKS